MSLPPTAAFMSISPTARWRWSRHRPDGYEEVGSFKVPGSGERPSWSHPVRRRRQALPARAGPDSVLRRARSNHAQPRGHAATQPHQRPCPKRKERVMLWRTVNVLTLLVSLSGSIVWRRARVDKEPARSTPSPAGPTYRENQRTGRQPVAESGRPRRGPQMGQGAGQRVGRQSR